VIAPLPALRPREVAERLVVRVDVVLAWIKRGELRACNVAQRAGGRPRWRILESDLQTFLASRAAQPPAPAVRRRKRDCKIVEYF